MIAVADRDRLTIYDDNGEMSLYTLNTNSDFNQITDIKWSNDGEYDIKRTTSSVQRTAMNSGCFE